VTREPAPIVVVVGPTAAGKSGLALALAHAVDAEIVSADSQQVYRHFDIGTAKPAAAERRAVPHHLIDVVEPDAPFSAARFVELADAALAAIAARGRRAVVVGGTGLYVRALLRGLFDAPPPDPAIRAEHRRRWHAEGGATLHAALAAVDPEAAARIDPRDLVRISRALEVYEQTGVPISELQRRHAFAEVRHRARLIGIAPPREELRRRIEARVDAMLAAGWLDEVRRLCANGWGECRPMAALGYRHLRLHLRGALARDEAVRQIKRDTWRFARRQLGWFAGEPEIGWLADAGERSIAELAAG
jgi:tRNA dimethylallyltransferase